MNFHIRPAGAGDITAINALVAAAFRKYVECIARKPEPMLTDYGKAIEEHQVWIAEIDGNRVGLLELVSQTDYLLIAAIAVSPDCQGAGLGKRLMAFAEAEAKRQGFSEVRLYTNERLTANLSFYARLGYRETHREPLPGGTRLVYMSKAV